MSPPTSSVSPPPVSARSSPEMPRAQPTSMYSPSLATKPKTFAQWVAAAKENTMKIKQNGSPSPLVWVLVEGKNIPTNAIVGGEDRRKPLYIARAFYEGGIYVGNAGHHLTLGGAIPYNGREIEVDTYEVLVPALQPIRYSVSDSLPIRDIPRMVQDDNQNIELHRFREMKTVILVDDSMSMAGALWEDAREALAGVADLAAKYGFDGVDVYFLNNPRYAMDVTDGRDVRQLFDSVIPNGQTPTGQALEDILNKYIPFLEDGRLAHKPITIVVITDGVPTDDPKEVIINAARRLDHSGVPDNKLGIQFAQIGNDEDATDALRELDEGIADINGIRDMVDTTPFNPNDVRFTTATIVKILLGALSGLAGASGPVAGSPNVPRPGVAYR